MDSMNTDLPLEAIAEIEARKRIAALLGSAQERKALRQRLGLSARDVAAIVGLSERAILWRESPDWIYSRGSLTSPEGVKYLKFLASARGDESTTAKASGRASPKRAAA